MLFLLNKFCDKHLYICHNAFKLQYTTIDTNTNSFHHIIYALYSAPLWHTRNIDIYDYIVVGDKIYEKLSLSFSMLYYMFCYWFYFLLLLLQHTNIYATVHVQDFTSVFFLIHNCLIYSTMAFIIPWNDIKWTFFFKLLSNQTIDYFTLATDISN